MIGYALGSSDLKLPARAEIERRRRQDERKPEQHGKQYHFRGDNQRVQSLTDPAIILSGPADTGKTLAALCYLNRMAWKYPGMQGAIIRKVYADLPGTALQTFQKKVILTEDGIVPYGGENRPEKFIYPNGSVIWVGGLDKPGKVLSSERDIIYVNQAEELALQDWETLTTRATTRAGNMPYAQVVGDCNPAAPTHWIKTLAKEKKLTLLVTTHKDNPEIFDAETGELTPGGAARLDPLRKLSGSRLMRLFHGLWAAPEGAIYAMFEEEKHKIESFIPPATWPRIVGIDPYGAFVAAIFLAFDPGSNQLHAYREYYEPFGITTPEHATNILALAGYGTGGVRTGSAESIFAWVGGGPSENQARLDWQAAGIPMLEPPITDVWAGIDRVSQLLADYKLLVHEDCVNLLSEIGSYKRVLKDGQPTEAIENKDAFHVLDALRYIVAWLTEPGEGQIVYSPVPIGPNY